jgi:hypothetical protein
MNRVKLFLAIAIFGTIACLGGFYFLMPGSSSPSVSEAGEVSLPVLSNKVTEEFLEDCPPGSRCRCRKFKIIQTVITAGVHKANKKYDAIRRIPRCQASSGYHATLREDACMVCPAGMTYSALLRGRDAILQRMNLPDDVCVAIKKTCMDKAGQRTRSRN